MDTPSWGPSTAKADVPFILNMDPAKYFSGLSKDDAMHMDIGAALSSGEGTNVGPDAVTQIFIKELGSKRRTTLDDKHCQSLSEWGVGDQRLALFFKLVRDLKRQQLQEFVRNIVGQAIKRGQDGHADEELQGYADLFVLAFQTRDIQEGKGERLLSFWLIVELSKYFPLTARACLPLFHSKYGSWVDVLLLLEIVGKDMQELDKAASPNATRKQQLTDLEESLLTLMQRQLLKDDLTREKIAEGRAALGQLTGDPAALKRKKKELAGLNISLCGKWAPRERGKWSRVAKRLALRMFGETSTEAVPPPVPASTASTTDAATPSTTDAASPSTTDAATDAKRAKYAAYKKYRKLVSRLNKALNTVEVTMCDTNKIWDQLKPGQIPARCLKLNRDAFMNKTKANTARSDREDRVKCAQQFKDFLTEAIKNPTKAKVHGKNMMPHELVHYYYDNEGVTEDDLTLEAQWVNLRANLQESGSLGNFIAMVDVSGSMTGRPMEVAIAMGILASECACPAFQHRFITFHDKPSWHVLDPEWSLRQKVESARNAAFRYTTNFAAALQMILDTCVKAKLPAEQVADITFGIFSDMQFDDADGTTGSEIQKRLQREGGKMGEVVVSLLWNCSDDLDLAVITPIGEKISYQAKQSSCGGHLDIDMNASGNVSLEPVENIYWMDAQPGIYKVEVNNYSNRSKKPKVPFEVHLCIHGVTKQIDKVWTKEGPQMLQVCEFEVPASTTKVTDLFEASTTKVTDFEVNGAVASAPVTMAETTVESFASKFDKVAAAFKGAGYVDKATGEAIVPRMLFWNLKGDTVDFPAAGDTPGVDMVSGFSASGLKAFMKGDVLATPLKKKATPYDGMRKQLDDERYDIVRLVCEAGAEITARTGGKPYRAPLRVTEEQEQDKSAPASGAKDATASASGANITASASASAAASANSS